MWRPHHHRHHHNQGIVLLSFVVVARAFFHEAPVARRPRSTSSSSSIVRFAAGPRLPPPEEKVRQGIAIATSCGVAVGIARYPRTLFAYHPLLAAAVAPLATTALVSVRSRARAAKAAKLTSSRTRARDVLARRIQLHFALAGAATVSAVGSVFAICANKNRLGKPHLASLHSRTGAAALLLWLGALAVAETKVWANGLPRWREGRFYYEPRWLWASKSHRRVGTAAYAAMLCAVASGVARTGYGATLPARPALLGGLALTGLLMFSGGGGGSSL